MKKVTLAVISLMSVSLLGAPLVQAEEATSEATVTLQGDDGEGETPLGPGGGENGGDGEEIEPPEGGDGGIIIPPQKGALRLSLLTQFNFGAIKMSGNTKTYLAELPTPTFVASGQPEARPNFIQVTDNRGSQEGWKVTAKLATQFANTDTTLDGSFITLNNGWAQPYAADNTNFAPTVPNKAVDLKLGADEIIATATAGNGMGTWNMLYGTLFAADQAKYGDATKSVTLTIPGSIKKTAGDYKASIQWTLTNTPNA